MSTATLPTRVSTSCIGCLLLTGDIFITIAPRLDGRATHTTRAPEGRSATRLRRVATGRGTARDTRGAASPWENERMARSLLRVVGGPLLATALACVACAACL